MTTKNYDYVIIGGGIAGLYSAYNILQKNPKSKIIILEKNKKIGGRIGLETFEGVPVVIGAGIGRKKKDTLLINLLNKLKIKCNEFEAKHKYSNLECNVKKYFNYLKEQYKIESSKKSFNNNLTFKQFAIKVLNKEKYENFKICSGYSDYENADIKDVLYYYQFDDNYSKYTGLSINWNLLKEKLVKYIISNNKKNIKVQSSVYKLRFDKKNNCYKVYYKKDKNSKDKDNKNKDNKNKDSKDKNNKDSKNSKDKDSKIIYSKKVIIASTIDTLKNLIPNYAIYNDIKPNSFLRVYAKFSKDSIDIMKKYVPCTTIVKGFLQKIIPINQDKGIYMIAYSDNKNANHLNKIINKYNNNENKLKLYKYFENLLIKSLNINNKKELIYNKKDSKSKFIKNIKCKNIKDLIKIINIKDYYWKVGTHYYKPLKKIYKNRIDFIKKAQNPGKNLFVVGECVALNQGWTEGALQSVENIKSEL
jgi:hypothetical protein